MRSERKGFTLLEMMTVVAVSSLLLVLLASIFKTGLFEVNRSSGRIEVVRNGRQAMDNIQRYLASVMPPLGIKDDLGVPLPKEEAIFLPRPYELHDPENGAPQPWQSRVQFYSQVDHLGGTAPLSARDLTNNSPNYAYEIAAVPGANNLGQDLVMRQILPPTPWTEAALPISVFETSVQPRYLSRRIGIADSTAPGGYRDGFLVRRLTGGDLSIQVNVSSELISDDLNRNKVQDSMPLVIQMNTVIQPPYFNLE